MQITESKAKTSTSPKPFLLLLHIAHGWNSLTQQHLIFERIVSVSAIILQCSLEIIPLKADSSPKLRKKRKVVA